MNARWSWRMAFDAADRRARTDGLRRRVEGIRTLRGWRYCVLTLTGDPIGDPFPYDRRPVPLNRGWADRWPTGSNEITGGDNGE